MNKYLSKIFVLLLAVTTFTACDVDDNNSQNYTEVDVSSGVFILNEGSYYSGVDGSLSHFNFITGNLTGNVYKQANEGKKLGGTPNDLLIDTKYAELYIVSTFEDRLFILDNNMKEVAALTITRPRALAQDDDYVYVSGYSGKVVKVQKGTHTIAATSEKVGDNLEGIVVRGGSVYVANSHEVDAGGQYSYLTNVVKLNTATLTKEKDITVTANPNSIKSDGTNLYVSCWGDYGAVQGEIQMIDAGDNVSSLGIAGSIFDVYKGAIYAVNTTYDASWNTTYEYYKYDATNGKTVFNITTTIDSPCGIGVDPVTGNIFIGSDNIGANGYADYAQAGYIVVLNNEGEVYGKFSTGVGVHPAHFAFTSTKTLVAQ